LPIALALLELPDRIQHRLSRLFADRGGIGPRRDMDRDGGVDRERTPGRLAPLVYVVCKRVAENLLRRHFLHCNL
jgi:hypothetical protein